MELADDLMISLDYDIDDHSIDLKTPSGIGNYVAEQVIQSRENDKMNSNGDLPGTMNGIKFSDWTGYHPVNHPQSEEGKTKCSELQDINSWQPLNYTDQIQVWDGPHIGLATPFAIDNGFEFVPQGPALFGTNTDAEAMKQLLEVIDISANLGDFEKINAEWIAFNFYSNYIIWMAAQKQLSIVDTAKLVFLHGGAEWDSTVSAWALKERFNNARPISQIQCIFAGQTIDAYSGPYQGVSQIPAENWQPYPAYDLITPLFRTPNFPDYVSGHACAAGAVFESYKRFFRSDDFGFSVTIDAGDSLVEPKIDDPTNPNYIAGVTDVPNSGPASIGYSPAQDVTLHWSTFSEAAIAVANSRMYLGIHFAAAGFDGISVGREVGAKAFAFYSKHLTGQKD